LVDGQTNNEVIVEISMRYYTHKSKTLVRSSIIIVIFNKSNLHTLLLGSVVAVFYIRSKAGPPPAPGRRWILLRCLVVGTGNSHHKTKKIKL